jgi:DNA-binding GntR family transcriptional regulator
VVKQGRRATAARKRYQEVAETLLGDIRSGKLAVGATLPGELELVEQFGVSRHTVREALRRLEQLGLIGRRQGRGTVVQARQSEPSYVQSVRTPAELLQYPEDARLALVASATVRTGRRLAKLLGCPVGTEWFRLSCLRRFRESKLEVCWVDVYVLPEFAGLSELIGKRGQPVYELIEECFGERIENVDVDIMARPIPAAIAGSLGVAPGTPSLTVVRRYYGAGRRLLEASIAEHPGERYTYSLQLRRGWQSGGGWST